MLGLRHLAERSPSASRLVGAEDGSWRGAPGDRERGLLVYALQLPRQPSSGPTVRSAQSGGASLIPPDTGSTPTSDTAFLR